MTYIYTKENRLETPHPYMYTPYQGVEFLHAYRDSRLSLIESLQDKGCNENKVDQGLWWRASKKILTEIQVKDNEFLAIFENLYRNTQAYDCLLTEQELDKNIDLNHFNTGKLIQTNMLLTALLSVQYDKETEQTKFWLDKLTQRFEVTKKLATEYPAGFRKGIGNKIDVRLYWLFSLCLSIRYASCQDLKFLSTLLKINDLLCSLPEEILIDKIPSFGLLPVFLVELMAIHTLANNAEINFDIT